MLRGSKNQTVYIKLPQDDYLFFLDYIKKNNLTATGWLSCQIKNLKNVKKTRPRNGKTDQTLA